METTNPSSSRLEIQKQRNTRDGIDRLLIAAHEMGDMPWESDPDETIKFLRQINEKHGMKIPINRDDIAEKLKRNDDRLKKMRRSYQNQLQEQSVKRRKCSTLSPRSVLEPTTSNSSSGENPGGNPAVVGGPPVLFLKRTLTASDMDDVQNRLSLPCSQVESTSFLTREERRKLENDPSGVKVKMLVPENNTRYDVHLKKTIIGKSGCYTINKPWKEIKKENRFKVGMKLEIRGYRDENDGVCLLFQRLN